MDDPEDKGPENVFLLEREITGLDWLRSPLQAPSGAEAMVPDADRPSTALRPRPCAALEHEFSLA